MGRRREREGCTFQTVRELGGVLPGVEEATSYGTPALKVRGKLFARLREDDETLVLRTDDLEREHLMRLEPAVFFITDHYRDYPWVLVRLPAVGRARLGELLSDAWRRVAPKRLVAAHDAAGSTAGETMKPSARKTTKKTAVKKTSGRKKGS